MAVLEGRTGGPTVVSSGIQVVNALSPLTSGQLSPQEIKAAQDIQLNAGGFLAQGLTAISLDSFKKEPAENIKTVDFEVGEITSFDSNSLGTSGKTPEEIIDNRAVYSLYKASYDRIESLFKSKNPTQIDRFKGTDSSKKQQTLEMATTQVVGKDGKDYILYQVRNDNQNIKDGQKSVLTYIRGKNTPVFGVISGDSITFTIFAQKIDTEPGWNPFTGNPMGLGKVDSKYVPFYTVTYKLSGNNADFNYYNNNGIAPTIVTVSNPVTNERALISKPDLTKKMASGSGALFSPIAVPPASTPRLPNTPRPPSTPIPKTPIPKESAKSIDNRNTLNAMGYPKTELDKYKEFTTGIYYFTNDKGETDPVGYSGLIGTKADGSKEMLAIKFSGIPDLIKLSGTELANYAKEARKSPISGSCFEKKYVGNQGDLSNPKMDINSVSTGILVQFEKDIDGKKIIFKTGLMATQTDQGIPVPFLAILQMEDASNPGVDLLENNFLWASKLSPSLSNEVHSVEEWKEIIPGGKHIKLGMRYVIPSTKIDGFSLFQDKFADEGYSKSLHSFFNSNGSERTNDLIIVLPWSVAFTE
jgi:hypothetical protein